MYFFKINWQTFQVCMELYSYGMYVVIFYQALIR